MTDPCDQSALLRGQSADLAPGGSPTICPWSGDRPLGIFVTRPWARFLIGAILPWITAVLLASAIWPLIPEHAMYYDGPQQHLTFADRMRFLYQGLILLPLMLIPPFVVLGTPAKLALRPLAKRIALVWRGWPLAGVYVAAGMVIGILVAMFYMFWVFEMDEHRLAFCAQWDTGNQGQWLDNPKCGSSDWQWAMTLIPGGAAGLFYWLAKYRPRAWR